jgi:hypothetical protein
MVLHLAQSVSPEVDIQRGGLAVEDWEVEQVDDHQRFASL